MATISNARLSIGENLPGNKVKVDVTCVVRFTPNEVFNMQHGLRFRLDAKLWGDDPAFDDSLYSFTRKMFPDASPSGTESIVFSDTVLSSKLNEDNTFPDYTDEVYGELTLRNIETGAQTKKKTNVISHHF